MPARGTVERFSEVKGYGYIRPADGGGVLFFHRAAVVDKTGPLEKGDEVVYVAVRTKKGLKVARDVGKARRYSAIGQERTGSLSNLVFGAPNFGGA